MPHNQIKVYNQLLEVLSLNPHDRRRSLRAVFDRDFDCHPSRTFSGKPIYPTPKGDEIQLETLFTHLTTVMIDKKSRQREFEMKRSIRLHWVRHHLAQQNEEGLLTFSIREPEGFRTYIYDKMEKYVVVLEPLRSRDAYYLLSAYYVEGKDAKRDKFLKKWRRRLPELL